MAKKKNNIIKNLVRKALEEEKSASKYKNEDVVGGCKDAPSYSCTSDADCSERTGGVWECIDDCCTLMTGDEPDTKKSPKGNKKIKEAELTAGPESTKFNLKVDVSNKQSETKLGIRIQLEPKEGFLEPDLKDKLEIAISKKLNNALEQFDMQVSKDTDVPDPTVIGFFIPLSQIKNMIVKSLGGGKTTEPTGPTEPTLPSSPTPPSTKPPLSPTSSVKDDVEEMINEELLKEMRVRDLKEISSVVSKDDFYEFINKGNNILRTLEEQGIPNGKKYLEYLVRHNII